MKLLVTTFALLASTVLYADTITTEVFDSKGTSLGHVKFEDSQFGMLITPNLHGLPMGMHGFHIHEHPDCGNHGMKAGGHLDPAKTNSHQGPYGKGHLGDLPVMAIDSTGATTTPLLAPRLKVSDIKGHALMIHAGGDNYTDTPPNGGGGDRIGCGKIG